MANATSSADADPLRRLMPHLGSKVVCVVSQKPFSINQSNFCSLEPLVFCDGRFPQQGDFPKNGLIWWMIDDDKADIAVPGQLVKVILEESNKAGQQGEDAEWYQAERHTVTRDDIGFIEVLLLPDDKISHPYDLLDEHLSLDRPPQRNVLIEWRGDFYGLWEAEVTANANAYDVSLRPAAKQDGRYFVHCIHGSDLELQKELRELRFAPEVAVSDQSKHRSNADTIELEISLAPTQAIYSRLSYADKVQLSNDYEFICDLLSRDSLLAEDNRILRNSVSAALASLSSTGSWRRRDVQLAAHRIRSGLEADEAHRRNLADALMQQGFLTTAIEHTVEDAVATRTKEIEQGAVESQQKLQAEIDLLSQRRDSIQNEVVEILQRAEEDAKQKAVEAGAQAAEQLAGIEVDIARLSTERDQLNEIVEPALERLRSARTSILQDYVLLAPILEKANITAPEVATQGNQAESVHLQLVPSRRHGPSIEDPSEFIEKRFLPLLNRFRQQSNTDLATYFHGSVLACRVVLANDLAWPLAYAEATGGDIVITNVEPDWLRFERVWRGEFEEAWRAAVNDPDRLVFMVLDGVDRSPTAAWLLPLLDCAAGHREYLPAPSGEPWPANLRLFVTLDENEAAFKIDSRILAAAAAVPKKHLGSGAVTEKPDDGHVTPAMWLEWARFLSHDELDLDTLLDEHQMDGAYRPMALDDCKRLASILTNLGVAPENAASLAIRFRVEEPRERLLSHNDE